MTAKSISFSDCALFPDYRFVRSAPFDNNFIGSILNLPSVIGK